MRLEQIDLKNFGSYREATIDLSRIASAVVLGPNGAGKSTAFIDAVLWALYGQARSNTDHMIRTGETDMMVSVVFALNGQCYRVIRKRSIKTKAGKSDLELQVQTGQGEWTPISGGRLQETQEKIVALLNCDQDLLTATSFFLQGQADRFSKATPAERKTILASILRLDRYAVLKQGASREATRLEATLAERRRQIQDLDALEHTLQTLRADLQEAIVAEANLDAQAKEHEERHRDLFQRRADLQAKKDSFSALVAQHAQAKSRLPGLEARAHTLQSKHDRWEKILSNRDTITAKQAEQDRLKREIEALEAAVNADTEAIGRLDRDIQRSTATLNRLAQIEGQIALKRHAVQAALQEYRRTTADLQAELGRDRDASALLSRVPCDAGLQARCQFTLRAVEAQQRIPEREALLAARATEDDVIASLVASSLLHDVRSLEANASQLRETVSEAALAEAQRQRADLQTGLDGKRREIEQRRAAIRDTERFTALLPELQLAEQEIVGIRNDLASTTKELADLRQALKDQELALLGADTIDRDLATVDQDLRALETAKDQTGRLLKDLAMRVGQIRTEIQTTEQRLVAGKAIREELAAIERDLRQYRVLAEAYGLIPVLIMENALPLLEQETNALLSKISRTGMRVRFDTQKALKSRDGLAETLDIAVRDALGERPLENYSGGERFRLDLALRIGLSKLLARRAGAKIETLAIDEGLGSLDEDGLQQLRECLGALGDDFKLVLVITHVDAMKATFPSQIMVTKDHQRGSQVEVLE